MNHEYFMAEALRLAWNCPVMSKRVDNVRPCTRQHQPRQAFAGGAVLLLF